MNEVAGISNRTQGSAPPGLFDPKSGFHHIMVATDFSSRSRRTVDYATALARSLGAQLTLLHIAPEVSVLDYSELSAFSGTMEGSPIRYEEEMRGEADREMVQELARVKSLYSNVDSRVRTAFSSCGGIVQVARELPADLLVLSTHGYTGWKHLLLGSYAERILERSPCPVLIIRAET